MDFIFFEVYLVYTVQPILHKQYNNTFSIFENLHIFRSDIFLKSQFKKLNFFFEYLHKPSL